MQSQVLSQNRLNNPVMPVKNIIPGQTVTKEKLQRAPSALSGTSPKSDMETLDDMYGLETW